MEGVSSDTGWRVCLVTQGGGCDTGDTVEGVSNDSGWRVCLVTLGGGCV